jgi:putative ABC transport system substrate-binding protein
VMNRRKFIAIVGGALAASWRSPARAQQPAKVWRIGLLAAGGGISPASTPSATPSTALSQAFEELGYVEGKNATFVARSADGRIERLPGLAAEMVRLGVDVIITTGSEATRAAKQATASIPIVFSGPSYPVDEGLVASFAHPGGNITGITVAMSDTVSKHLQLLRDVAPALANVAVIWSSANPGHTFAFRDTERAGASSRLKILSVSMSGADDLHAALATVERLRPDGLIVPAGPLVFNHVERVSELAVRLRIPSISNAKLYAERGLLMSYGADFREFPPRLAAYVDRIFKGARPADLPVERPTKFELVINAKTAKALGLTIPQSLLLRANEVIQ